jgi:hypothetical protein
MVDALREARRVLKPWGVLVNVRPVTTAMVVEVVAPTRTIWAKEVASYSTPEDVAASEAAVEHALSCDWFAFEKSLPYDFEIYCDAAADLRLYAQTRKLPEAEIPYEELEERRRELGADGQTARLRCRRPWLMSTYRKK